MRQNYAAKYYICVSLQNKVQIERKGQGEREREREREREKEGDRDIHRTTDKDRNVIGKVNVVESKRFVKGEKKERYKVTK